MAMPQVPLRSVALSLLAAVLTGVTAYDYLVGLPDRHESAVPRKATATLPADPLARLEGAAPQAPPTAAAPAIAQPDPAQPPGAVAQPEPAATPATGPRDLRQRAAELAYLRDHPELVRQRYQSIAAPYAEAVAGFATLLAPGQTAREAAGAAVRSLVPPGVDIKDMLITDAPASRDGTLLLTATLSLVSGDSQAMLAALTSLGDAGSGMVWKELSLGVDHERRLVSAKGQLQILMARHAE